MSKVICYSFPSRNRPEKLFAAIQNIRTLSKSKDYFIVVKIDMDDTSDYARLASFPEVIVKRGMSNNKVHAVNRDLDNIPAFDILCCHSDDMTFIASGFDDIIRMHCDKDDYVHFPDGFANERLCTYSIMGVDYYKRFGYIYHPDYKSLFADNEQFIVAKKLGRYKYVPIKILQHRHPAWGFGKPDALLNYTESFWALDEKTFKQRESVNFDLPIAV